MKKNEVLDKMISAIIFLLPFSIYFYDRLFKNILFPMLIVIAILKILKNGFKYSFYEKYFVALIFIIIVSIVFQNYFEDLTYYRRLKYIMRWSLLPVLVGQLSLNEKHFRIGIAGYFLSFIFVLNKSFQATTNFFFNSTSQKISYLEIFKTENLKTIENFNDAFRLRGLFPTITENAIMLGIPLIFTYCILLDKKIKYKFKILVVPFFILSFYFTIVTQARGMYLALIVTLLSSFAIKIFFSNNIKKNIIKLSSALLVLFLIIFITPKSNNYKEKLYSIAKGDVARMVIYKESFNLFKNNTLTGIGYGNFPQAENSIKNDFFYWGGFKHEHNMGLKMLAETGIGGFLIYYMMMGSIIYNLIKKRELLISRVTLGVISIFMIYESFETIVIYNKPNVYLFFLIALAINPFYKKIKHTHDV